MIVRACRHPPQRGGPGTLRRRSDEPGRGRMPATGHASERLHGRKQPPLWSSGQIAHPRRQHPSRLDCQRRFCDTSAPLPPDQAAGTGSKRLTRLPGRLPFPSGGSASKRRSRQMHGSNRPVARRNTPRRAIVPCVGTLTLAVLLLLAAGGLLRAADGPGGGSGLVRADPAVALRSSHHGRSGRPPRSARSGPLEPDRRS